LRDAGPIRKATLCHQVRSVDIKARKGQFKQKLPEPVVELVLDKLRAVLD
jgi:mRNA-degrading endonuclease toxin of MazEF toxin-antitoxin module